MNNDLENNINKLTGKNHGFNMPENYLEHIEDDIFIKLTEEQFSKKQPFTIPDNYFDSVETSILNQVNTKKETKVISLRKRILKFVPASIAASIILFLSIYLVNQQNTTENTTIALTDVEDWFNDNLSYTDDLELAFAFENDLNFTETNLSFDNNSIDDYFNHINTDDLIDDE